MIDYEDMPQEVKNNLLLGIYDVKKLCKDDRRKVAIERVTLSYEKWLREGGDF